MKTKEELLYHDPSTVEDIVKSSQKENLRSKDMMFVIAEVLIDIRDLMVDMDKNIDHMKHTLYDMKKGRYRDTGVR